jgi:predicted RNase H-like HicB family nuclease
LKLKEGCSSVPQSYHGCQNIVFRLNSPRRDLYLKSHSLELSVLKMVTFTAILHREGDMYVAECPEVGTVSQGATVEEAVDNLREATELYLDEFPLEEGQKSLMTTFEVAVRARA